MSIKNAVKAYDYLRGHIDNSVSQLVRIMERNGGYADSVKALHESAIDLKSALLVVENRTITLETIDQMEAAKKRTQERYLQGKLTEEEMYRELAYATFEVAVAEIDRGGFHAHAIGTNGKNKVKEESRRVDLGRSGSFSYIISVPISRWRDVTNIKIVPVKGV